MSGNPTSSAPGGPLSFKTVPGRHRTQKWNTAPKNTYDGDDWGGYDPYDEYGGAYDEPEPPLPGQPSALPSQKLRRQSFDHGDDGARSVSAPFSTYQQPSGSAPAIGSIDDERRSRSRPRDFTDPDQAPAPLNASRGAAASPPGTFPARKSSMGGSTYEAVQQAAEAQQIAASVAKPAVKPGGSAASPTSPSLDKPLPFIRPSDIYKRMDEERRRESEDSSRPSMDALERVTSAEQRRADLPPVKEQRESVLSTADHPIGSAEQGNALPPVQSTSDNLSAKRDTSPTLPLTSRFSGFGEDLFKLRDSPQEQSTTAAPPVLDTKGLGTASSSIQQTPTASHAPQTTTTAEPSSTTDGLQHQPSVGFRSAVHQAFDQNDASLSRDNSGSAPSTGGGVGRSDASSTAGISPIMSRVPSAATAAFNQRQLEGQTPMIAEEATPTGARRGYETLGVGHRVARKSSPAQSRTSNAERVPATFEPGYRRSLDPPSSGTSPARTPAVETVESRRLSTPLSGVMGADDPDVADQGAEVVKPELHATETAAHETPTASAAIPIPTRGRSNTDYSIREADLANAVNASPEKDAASAEMVDAVQESKDSRELFLRTHDMPNSSSPVRNGTPSRSDSPAKSRVREIAEKYQEIHNDSRRNSAASIGSSKSGWSTFTDDAKPRPKRAGTGQSGLGQASARPEIGREESFKPDLPGGWINSEAPTPAVEALPSAPTHDGASLDQPIDLTPTTQKHRLQDATTRSPIDATKDMGEQLGAAFMSQYGVGHQTRDFASKEPPAPVDQSEDLPKRVYGEVPPAPPLLRQETDSTDAPTSVASSAAPTPLPKDTPQTADHAPGNANLGGEYFNTVAPLRVRSREPSPEHSAQPAVSRQQTHVSDESADDDRIRAETVRSLDSSADGHAQAAPDEQRRAEGGDSVLPAAATAAALGAVTAAATTAAGTTSNPARPALLNTRFSWEMSEPVREEPKSPEIKPEAAYERPRSRQLHIMNPELHPVSPVSPVDDQKISEPMGGALSIPAIQRPEAAAAEGEIVRSLSQRVRSPVSPIVKEDERLDIPETTREVSSLSQSLRDDQASLVSERSPRIPSYYAESHPDASQAAAADSSPTLATTTIQQKSTPQITGQIPAFRNILQIKDADERIKTYDSTRQIFADMNTGLGDWLQNMTIRHPDVQQTVEQGKPPPLEPSVSAGNSTQWKRGHRAGAPSINLTNLKTRFASGGQGESSGRTASTGGGSGGLSTSDNAGGSGGVDLDRVQQKGKEFMKNAGVFGSKAGAGAKGLLAKGRSRFGGSVRGKEDLVAPPARPQTKRASSSVLAKLRSVSSPSSPSRTSLPIHSSPVQQSPERNIPHASAIGSHVARSANQSNDPTHPTHSDDLPYSTLAGGGTLVGTATEGNVVEKTTFVDEVEAGYETAESQSRLMKSIELDSDLISQHREMALRKISEPAVDSAELETLKAEYSDDKQGESDQRPATATTTVAALAEQISEAETRSEAVQELRDAGPVLQEYKASLPEEMAPPASDSGPARLMEGTHVPLAAVRPMSHASVLVSPGLEPSLITNPNRSSTLGPQSLHGQESDADKPGLAIFSTPDLTSTLGTRSYPALRPELARQASNSGVSAQLALRSRRDRSATPAGSASREPSRSVQSGSRASSRPPLSASGRPLSGVIERLKDRTRSWSRSRSRPASLVFWKGESANYDKERDLTPRGIAAPDDALRESFKRKSGLMDFSDVAVDPTRSSPLIPGDSASPGASATSPTSPQRTEAWNDPDAKLPITKTPEMLKKASIGGSGLQGRLGVLPSPAPTAATFVDAGQRTGSLDVQRHRRQRSEVSVEGDSSWKQNLEQSYSTVSSAVPPATVVAGALTGEPLQIVPSQGEIDSPALGGRFAPTNTVPAGTSARSSPTKGPMRDGQRKVSDISTLPSQLHRRATSEGVSSVSVPSTAVTSPISVESRAGSTAVLPSVPISHSRNESQVSNLTDVELVEASPLTISPAEPVVVQHGDERDVATPTFKRNSRPLTAVEDREDASRWDRAVSEQEDGMMRLEGTRSEVQLDLISSASERPTSRDRPSGGAFASIIASATTRKEKEKSRKVPLVEAQQNPYVLSPADASRTASSLLLGKDAATEKWEDARSEVSAEEGAADDDRTSIVSSIDAAPNMDVRPVIGSRTASGVPGEHVAGTVPAVGDPDAAGAAQRPATADAAQTSFDTVRAVPEQQALLADEPMSAQAVPAGPSGASPTSSMPPGLLPGIRQPSSGSTDFQKRFSQRLYAQRPGMMERPMSYITLPRDEGGFLREEIDTRDPAARSWTSLAPIAPVAAAASKQEDDAAPVPADLSALSGPPAGTQPFQAHPVFRNSGVQSPPQGGYFGLPQALSPGNEAVSIPLREMITDDHGLEDVHAWADNVVETPRDEYPPGGGQSSLQQQQAVDDGRNTRRKSLGKWKSAFGSNKPLASLENSENVNANITAGEPDWADTVKKGAGKRNTLVKPQRASSNVVKLSSAEDRMPEQQQLGKEKKKRFSGLKSFLGRASTTSGGGGGGYDSKARDDRRQRLTKAAPPTPLKAYYQPGNPAMVQGGVNNYQDYETVRQREMAAFAKQSELAQQILASRARDRDEGMAAPYTAYRSGWEEPTLPKLDILEPTSVPPADGWYGPSSQKTHVDETRMTAVEQGYSLPDFKRVDRQQLHAEQRSPHSAGSGLGSSLPLREYDLTTPSPVVERQLVPKLAISGQGSDGSVPVSGRTEYWNTERRPFGSVASAVSPITPVPHHRPSGSIPSAISPAHPPSLQLQTQGHAYDVSTQVLQQQETSPTKARVVSMGTEIARSPAKEYDDQQTPFAITLPAGSREVSWGASGAQQQQQQHGEEAQERVPGRQQYQYAEPEYAWHGHDPQRMQMSLTADGSYGSGMSPSNGNDGRAYESYNENGYRSSEYGRHASQTSPQNQSHASGPYVRPLLSAQDWMSRQNFQQGQQYSHPAQSPLFQSRTEAGSQAGWYPRQYLQPQPHPYEPEQAGSRRRSSSDQRRYYSQPYHAATTYAPTKPYPSHPPLSAAMQQQQQQQRQYVRGEDGGVDYYGSAGGAGQGRRRASSGYTGRRDDPAVSEDEVDMIMRGASYPGMEWNPYASPVGRRGS